MNVDIIREFEEELIKIFKVRDAIVVNSGTSALIASLMACGLNGGEVITSPYTFQATANAILLAGGKPIFADIIDENIPLISSIEINRYFNTKTKAILPVHLFGKTQNIKYYKSIFPSAYIIEDACQAFLAKTNCDKYAGTMGDAGCFSFYKSKNLSTFEGGAIIIPHDSKLDEIHVRALTNQGQVGRFNHKYVGFNFRMAEPLAQIGLHQLKYHRKAIEAELGKYGPEDGYYPKVVYNQSAFKNLGITGNCPIAESLANKVRNM